MHNHTMHVFAQLTNGRRKQQKKKKIEEKEEEEEGQEGKRRAVFVGQYYRAIPSEMPQL